MSSMPCSDRLEIERVSADHRRSEVLPDHVRHRPQRLPGELIGRTRLSDARDTLVGLHAHQTTGPIRHRRRGDHEGLPMVSSRVSTCTAVIFICDAPRVVGGAPSLCHGRSREPSRSRGVDLVGSARRTYHRAARRHGGGVRGRRGETGHDGRHPVRAPHGDRRVLQPAPGDGVRRGPRRGAHRPAHRHDRRRLGRTRGQGGDVPRQDRLGVRGGAGGARARGLLLLPGEGARGDASVPGRARARRPA